MDDGANIILSCNDLSRYKPSRVQNFTILGTLDSYRSMPLTLTLTIQPTKNLQFRSNFAQGQHMTLGSQKRTVNHQTMPGFFYFSQV